MNFSTRLFSSVVFRLRGVFTARKAQAGFAFALLGVGAIGMVAYLSVNRLREDEEWTRHTEVVISSLHLLLSHATDGETAQRGYAISGEEQYLEPYRGAQRRLAADLDSLRTLTKDNVPQQRRLDALEPLVVQRMARLGEEIELRRSQGFAAAQAATVTGVGKQLHDEIRSLVAEMEEAEHGFLLQRQLQAKRGATMARVIIIGGSSVALGIVLMALLAVGRDFARRRGEAVRAALAGRLSRMGAWVVELPSHKQTWSDEVCAIYEVPPGTTLPVEQAIDRYAPEFHETISRAFEACARDGTPYDVELQIITATGRRVWVRTIGEAERNAAGVIRRVQGALQDISSRKEAEEEARELAERFSTTLDSLTDGFITLDREWRFTYVNREAERMLGFPQVELLGSHIWTKFPEARGSVSQVEYERAMRENVAVQFETYYPPLEAWFDARAFPSRQGLAVYFRDVTERHRKDDELRWKTALMEAQVNSSLDGMIVADRQGKKILQNQRFADLWKTPQHIADDPDDAKQLQWNAQMSTDPTTFAEQVAWLHAHPHESSREEIELTNGTVLDRYTAPVIGKDGTYYGRIRMIRDITDRRRAEETLRKTEEDFRTMANNISQLAWMADAKGDIFWYNDRWFDYSGTTLEEMAGSGWRKLHHPDHEARVVEKITRCFQSGEIWDDTFPLRGRDGEYRWFLSRAVPIRDAEGTVLRWFGTNTDVTENKLLEAELAVARDQALASVRMKSEFLANMSHEIRTPMNGVLGMTELVLETSLTQEQRGYLEMAQSSGNALLRLINDILDFSKIEAGKLELEAIGFNLREFVGHMLEPLVYRAGQKQVEMAAQIAPRIPEHLVGDPLRLRQVLSNFADNAIKFTERGSIVLQVTSEGEDDGELCLHFSITDTGIGIPPEKQALIFEAFAQVDGSTTRNYGGTGLGLAIASQLVRQMEGRIWVESTLGQGTSFHFTARFGVGQAPLATSVAPAVITPLPLDSPPAPGLRILLAEDNLINRTLITAILQKRGHSIVHAFNGRTAVAAVAGEAFDLIFMDVQMPEMDGFEAVSLIRECEQATGRHTPIVAMTAHAMAGDRERCLAAGMDDYLSKPLKKAELLALLARIFWGQGSTAIRAVETAGFQPAERSSSRLALSVASGAGGPNLES